MVSLFEKSNKMKNCSSKSMSLNHQEFLKRIKKSLYYGPSNPDRMTSMPLATHVSKVYSETHRNYSLNNLDLDTISKIRQQTPCNLILALIYLERLNALDPQFVKLVSPSELFLVILMVSTKFYNDLDELDVFASAWAEEGGVDVKKLVQLETKFLNAIQFNLLVNENEFHEKLKTVERLLAMKEGLARGWFTYTELELLMPTIEIAKCILNYTSILMFSFACSVATIALSSVILASIPTSTGPATRFNQTISSSALLKASLIKTDSETYDSDYLDRLDDKSTRNFTINFPLFDRIMHWEIKKNYQDITNFPFMPSKHDSVPLHW